MHFNSTKHVATITAASVSYNQQRLDDLISSSGRKPVASLRHLEIPKNLVLPSPLDLAAHSCRQTNLLNEVIPAGGRLR